MFDPSKPPTTPRLAASVILVRSVSQTGIEVFLLRRHRKSSFMSNAFVFPGGRVDDGESVRLAAIRELFEEAGVLLVNRELPVGRRDDWRTRINAGTASFADMLADENLAIDEDALCFWSHWITPSVEPKRFDARFFLAALPAGQTPSFDNKETTEELWLSPAEAIARHEQGKIMLPPPQLRTLVEMLPASGELATLMTEGKRRAPDVHPILPRFSEHDGKVTLLLPWDKDYESVGVGESKPMPAGHPHGVGPSRVTLDNMIWRLS